MSDIQVHKLVKVSILKKIYNYNELKCSLKIAKLRLELITKLKYKNRDDEKLKLKEKIKYYNNTIQYIDKQIKLLNNIELDLFKTITCENCTITKGIEKIASKYFLDTCTIWKNYYPKIKPLINNLEIKEEI